MAAKRIAVVGGSGFLGSAVCKAAVAKGYEVISLSRSGKPFKTPAGHHPAWTKKVDWLPASAFSPESYAPTLAACAAVVHTVGVLLESDYKSGLPEALRGLSLRRGDQNPLTKDQGVYERMNRDSALAVARTFLSTPSSTSSPSARPFIYISAADVFRPLIPARYIETKREAEAGIARLALDDIQSGGAGLRDVYLRPGLMYHPHLRPLSTLPAALLDALTHLPALPLPIPSLPFLPPSTHPLLTAEGAANPLSAVHRLLRTPPLHVDTVGRAAVEAVERAAVQGPVEPRGIEGLAWGKSRGGPEEVGGVRTAEQQQQQAAQ